MAATSCTRTSSAPFSTQAVTAAAVDDLAHGELDDLAALGAGDVEYLEDLGGDVAGGGVIADAPLYPGDQFI